MLFDLFIILEQALSSPSPKVGEVRWGVMFKDDILLLGRGTFLLWVLDAGVDSWRLASDSADRALRDERVCLGQTSSA